MKRSRLKNIGELLTRVLGAFIYNERYMSLCGCLWKDYLENGKRKWLVSLADRVFREPNHCQRSYIKSLHLQQAAQIFSDKYGN
jgi:hypothetical protein